MAAPAYSGVGTGHESSVSWPTHSSGDLGLLFVQGGGSVSTPSGWTLIASVTSPIGTSEQTYAFYRFATSGAESAVTISSTDHAWGVILTATGADTTTPHAAVGIQSSNASNTVGFTAGLVTPVADCLVVTAVGYSADNAGPMASGETNATLTSLTERFDAGTLTGNGGGLVLYTGTIATAGVVDPTTITLTTTGYSSIVIAIRPPASSGGITPPRVGSAFIR